jgi:carbonic anhydrase
MLDHEKVLNLHTTAIMKIIIILTISFTLAATSTTIAMEQSSKETHSTKENDKVVDAGKALKRLQDGNARFVAGKSQHPHVARDWRSGLEDQQNPFAVVLGCSDSRVPPELIFDQGFGDLFIIRVAGNVVDTDVAASIEYAVDHLDTRLVVVMGHSNCGAITAALDHLASPGDEPAEVISLLYQFEPAVVGISDKLPRPKQIGQGVKRNVELAVRRLTRVPDLRRSIKAGKVKIVGMVYDMHTGKMEMVK